MRVHFMDTRSEGIHMTTPGCTVVAPNPHDRDVAYRCARSTKESHVIEKTWASAAEAVADLPDGASLADGGFGLSGNPIAPIESHLAQGTKDPPDRERTRIN